MAGRLKTLQLHKAILRYCLILVDYKKWMNIDEQILRQGIGHFGKLNQLKAPELLFLDPPG